MEVVGRVARALSGATCRATVRGAERLPLRGPALLIVNHTTIVDVAPVLAELHRANLRPSRPCEGPGCGSEHGHVRFLATELLFRHALLGPLVRHAGFIEVGFERPATSALDAARSALRRGEVVGIYPEGDVSAAPGGGPRRVRAGAARLAKEFGCPVVPLAHHDARRIGAGSTAESLRGALRSVLRRPALWLVVGEPLTALDYAHLPTAEVSSLFRDRLTETWELAAGSGGPVDRPVRRHGEA